MSSLRARLDEIARSFADAVLEALKGASIRELSSSAGTIGNGRRGRRPSTPRTTSRSSGRLPRRSADDIAKALHQIVALVKKHGDGLRAEQIRQQLGLQAKEMPRVLKEGLTKKVLKTKGQKRATTYFAK